MNIPPAGFSAITAASLGAWLWALIWAAILFAAIIGYGAALLRVFNLRRPTLVLAAAAGLGPAIFLGGLLNLLHAVTPPALIAFTLIGLALAALTGPKPIYPPPTVKTFTTKLLLLAITLVLTLRIASTVHDCTLQQSDDYNYYLAAPKKMLQMHFFAPDPYSERRVISSIGGNEFLGTLVLATQPLEAVQMADWTLGVFLLALLAFALGREFSLTAPQRYLLTFLLLITPQLRFNLTFVVLPSAVFLALVYVAANRRLTTDFPATQAAIAGSLVGAVATMKSPYLTHGAIFLLCVAVIRWRKYSLTIAFRFLGLAAVAGLAVMLPWMIASHATSATWLFPILGKGFHYSAYGHYASPSNFAVGILLKKVLPFCLPMLVLFLAEFYLGPRDEQTLTITALMLTALIGSILNGMATGGDSVRRYNYPCILPAITLAYVVFARGKNLARGESLATAIRKYRLMETAAAFFALLVAINTGTTKFTDEYRAHWLGLKASLTAYTPTTARTRDEYTTLEHAIPTDAPSLATLDNPFLLDFTQHNIFIADFPGTASPKPGWPTWSTGEAFAQFLLAHNVRYLIYSYGECNPAPYPTCDAAFIASEGKKAANPNITRLIRNEASLGIEARRQYGELAITRRHIYDDGHIYILDLTQPTT